MGARVNGSFATSLALSVILLWITLVGNIAHEVDRQPKDSSIWYTYTDIEEWPLKTSDETNPQFEDEWPYVFNGKRMFRQVPDKQEDIPTVYPGNCADSESRARTLFNVVQESPAAYQTVVDTYFSQCTRAERQSICNKYRDFFDMNLIIEIQRILKPYWTPKFDQIGFAISITDDLSENLAGKLYMAVASHPKINYNATRLILTPLANDSLTRNISSSFRKRIPLDSDEALFDKIITDDLQLRNIMESQLNGLRSTNTIVDSKIVMVDAKHIRDAVQSGKWEQDIDHFHRILLKQSYSHLRQVIEVYKQDYDDNLEEDIRAAFSLNAAEAYIDILQFAKNKAEYFARKLNAAITGISDIDNKTILYTIVYWRAEIDLGDIKNAYSKLYNVSLYDSIEAAVKQDLLRDALLASIGR